MVAEGMNRAAQPGSRADLARKAALGRSLLRYVAK